ncbi:efflux RND transporter periplasmic adaptor subunit [Roseateles sp.]|uniref:efflux RND transporter periplasmic adaptor subunit n=1 Tax=Roseateles sp. TaxID=1971397 RepID=UPI0025DD5590|nr:efflux RND transporter periplasmic adaptor subunit [Roseateles sp.]MBV8037687.1 efflux RND transporter periplasmic adaptor subunit [Roseateles sp.]
MNPSTPKPLLLLLLAAALLAACQDREPAPAAHAAAPAAAADEVRYAAGAPQLAMLRSQPAEAFAVPLAQPLEARLAYDEDVTARLSTSVSGRVVELPAAPGDVVRAGQPLLVLDTPDLGSAQADLARADADVALKQRAAARLRELAPGDAVAHRELEQAEAELAQARTERERAERRLHNLNPRGLPLRGQRLTLASPLAGVVTERNVGPAAEVAPAPPAPLFVVSDLRRLWVLADLPEKLVGRVRAGDRLLVETDAAPGERREARVVQVGRVIDPSTRRATLRAALDNRDGRLLPEMFVRAWLQPTDGVQAVRVPNAAVVNRGVYAFVFVEIEPGRFKRRRVELAARGGDDSFVKQGLAAGERVVVSGALLLDAELAAPQP